MTELVHISPVEVLGSHVEWVGALAKTEAVAAEEDGGRARREDDGNEGYQPTTI